MKLLIIGGTGLLSGAALVEALKQGIEVTIVNRGKSNKAVPNGVNVITADYRNETIMRSFLKNKYFDAAIDFICFNKEQIEYSANLLSDYCRQYIFISSACVYDYTKPGIKKENDSKVFSEWDYSVNKWECECYLRQMSQEKSFNYTIIRPCITYDNTRIPYGIMPAYGFHWTFVGRILSGKPIIRWNGGTTKWSMMRVEDFSVGLVGVIGNERAYNQAFNISGDNSYSWNDVIKCVEKSVNRKAVLYDISTDEYIRLMPNLRGRILGRSFDLICDNSKIKDLVSNFSSTYSLQEGIDKTIRSYIAERYYKGIDFRYDGQLDFLVRKSVKLHNGDSHIYKLGFVDYMGNASYKNRLGYYISSIGNKNIDRTRDIVKNIFLK